MKMITGFKSALVIGLSLAALAVLPSSAAEPVEALPDEVIQEDSLIIESPGQEEEGEQLIPSEEQLEQIQEGKTGTIRIQLTEGKEGTSINGIRFYCIRVADIEQGEYVLNEEYSQSGIDLKSIENADQLDTAAASLAKVTSEGSEAMTDDLGYAVFEDLDVGVYLIKAEDNASYDAVTPTLVAVPTWDEEAGEMSYDITVVPKHTPRPDTPETTNTAPQTNLNDHTAIYLALAAGCLILALILMMTGRGKKSRN